MTMLASRQAGAAAPAAPLSALPHVAALDGLRGVAALAVVLVHSFESHGYVPNGDLAVDLFFVLSGFVIASSYDDRLIRGLTAREFLLRRFVRLYPMLFAGALGGAVVAIDHWRRHGQAQHSLPALLAQAALSFVCLPWMSDATENGFAFSFNPPIWSLFFEILANLAYVGLAMAGLGRRPGVAMLALIVAAGLAGVVWFGPLGGAAVSDFVSGLPRVACGFFGGVLLFRLTRARAPTLRAEWVAPFLVLAALFALPVRIGGWLFPPAFAMLCLVVLGGARARRSRLDPVFAFLGLVSYPVYLLHWVTLYLFAVLGRALHLIPDHYAWVALLHLAAVPGIGYLAARCYETPLRRRLGRVLLAQRPPPGH